MIYKTQLDNGLQIIIDQDLNSKTCTIQYTVAVGALDETGSYLNDNNFGVCHFIEHMQFKGTNKRTVKQINDDIAKIGGITNAYTGFDRTSFYISSPADVWKQNFEILNDIFWNSTFPEDEFNKEKTVILEELKMYDDQPKAKCLEQLDILCNSKYENRQHVAGTIKSVKALTVDDLKQMMKKYYQPNNIALIVSGNVPINDFITEAEYYVNNKHSNNQINRDNQFTDYTLNGNISTLYRNDISQSHLAFMLAGVPAYDKDHYVQEIMSDILGLGFTSRLYRIIREELGLAYTVSVSCQGLRDVSYIVGYCGLDAANIDQVHYIIVKELSKLKYEYISKEELDTIKAVNKGQILLALEPTAARISIHENNFINNTNYTIDDIINKIENVTAKDIRDFANQWIYKNNICWSIVSPK